MMKPHCDRCEQLIDNYPSWCTERFKGNDLVWHIYINVDHNGDGKIFCHACMIAIISLYLSIIKEEHP